MWNNSSILILIDWTKKIGLKESYQHLPVTYFPKEVVGRYLVRFQFKVRVPKVKLIHVLELDA